MISQLSQPRSPSVDSGPRTKSTAWHLLTGEYPPDCGGVGDYTAQLAQGLADRECRVHVWHPSKLTDTFPTNRKSADDDASAETSQHVTLHEVPGGFWGRGLRSIDASLERFTSPRTILVQYAPNAFGLRGMNLPFCQWLWRRSRLGDDVRVMFHEPYFYFTGRRPWRTTLAIVQRLMASILIAASRDVYLSTSAWETYLRPYAWDRERPMAWLPIPPTIRPAKSPLAVDGIRRRIVGNSVDAKIVGHFGTYGSTEMLQKVCLALLDGEQSVLLLIGRGSERFAERLGNQRPQYRQRIRATGYLNHQETSLHLQACDVMVQPFRDGATSRRTSLMACLVHGVATVTNRGFLTEPLWMDCELAIARQYDATDILRLVRALLADTTRRKMFATRGEAFCHAHFSLHRTLDGLTGSNLTDAISREH